MLLWFFVTTKMKRFPIIYEAGITKQINLIPFSPVFHNYQNTGYLLIITFIYLPSKYECASKVNTVFIQNKKYTQSGN